MIIRSKEFLALFLYLSAPSPIPDKLFVLMPQMTDTIKIKPKIGKITGTENKTKIEKTKKNDKQSNNSQKSWKPNETGNINEIGTAKETRVSATLKIGKL